MDIYTFFKVLQRNWWLIVLSLIATLSSTAFFVTQQTPVYESSTTLELQPSPTLADVRDVMRAWETIGQRAMLNTVAQKANSARTLETVARELNSPALMNAEVSAVVLPETYLIEIRANSTDAELAASIANSVATELIKSGPQEVVQLVVLDRARPALIPIEPRPVRALTLGAVAGVALGLIFAFLEHTVQVALAGPRRGRDQTEEPEESDSQGTRRRRVHETL